MVYDSALQLWHALKERAGLNVADAAYDAALVDELQQTLFPGSVKPFETSLKDASPPVLAEMLLRSFLKAVQPFSLMKIDILAMMSAAGSSKGNDNLKIRFHFSETDDPLEVLLRDFREQMEVIEKKTLQLPTRHLEVPLLWQLVRVAEKEIGGLRDEPKGPFSPDDRKILDWISAYRSTRQFDPFPDVPPTGIDALDQRLGEVINLLQSLVSAYRRHAGDYQSLRAADRDPARSQSMDPVGLPLSQLWWLESDYWSEAAASWLLRLRVALRRDGASLPTAVIGELDRIFPPTAGPTITVEELNRRIEDILNLPVWKRRNEVYAVWIGSQIWRALEDGWDCHFHVQDGTLSFAFAGVHLATLVNKNRKNVVVWWTELQTPAANLPSGHRSQAIKPDYRIRRAPLSSDHPDALIVEVKQYKRSNTDNFSAAIADYAHACPRAAIVLANYGPISDRVLENVPADLRSRVSAFAYVRPDREAECRTFRRAVGLQMDVVQGVVPVGNSRIELRWGEQPSDLDLHVFEVGKPAGQDHVYFGQRTLGTAVRLLDDVTNGHGPEIVAFENTAGVYLVCVHQYSNDGNLTASGAIVIIYDDRNQPRITCEVPREGTGRWWIVCEVDFSTGNVRRIDHIVNMTPWPTNLLSVR